MEALLELALPVLALVATFVLGWLKNKPGYTKGKNILASVSKALEDDKLTQAELDELKKLVKP